MSSYGWQASVARLHRGHRDQPETFLDDDTVALHWT